MGKIISKNSIISEKVKIGDGSFVVSGSIINWKRYREALYY